METRVNWLSFEWALVGFAFGIAVYFAWPEEPKLATILIIAAVAAVFMTVISRKPHGALLFLLCFFVFGFARTSHHGHRSAAPKLPDYHKSYVVTGWVENISRSGSLQHHYIRVRSLDGLSPEKTPYRVRIRMKPQGINAGDFVQIKAVLSAPPVPVIAGGYDSARAAFFKRIGGYGFAVSAPEAVTPYTLPVYASLQRSLVTFRFALSRRIQARAPPQTAGLQAALLTGDRSAIGEGQEDALRDAGLAHLLAISGLHMGLLAGGAYFIFALGFAMIEPLARHYDMRKPAAVLGALFAIGYYLISGGSVSTQRALIMALIVFAAILLDRRAVSMRSVAVAAAITLFFHPESLLSAGFQMSFAATAALVAVYRNWSDRRQYRPQRGFFSRIWSGFIGVSVTSLVAGVATAVFAALHFHRFARYGFFANIIAMPIFSLIVMPAGFVAVLAMPTGLDGLFLKVMGLGLDFILKVSEFTASRDGAIVLVKGANGWVAGLVGLGFVFLCLGPRMLRIAGLIAGVLAIGLWSRFHLADIRISAMGRVAFRDPENVRILHVDSVIADRFGRARFSELAGLKPEEIKSYLDTRALCDKTACRFDLKGTVISVVNAPEGVLDACADSQLVILTERVVGPVVKRKCKSILVDTGDLERNGARDIYLRPMQISTRTANPQKRKARLWGGRL